MPSNNELINDIETEAKAKGVNVPETDGKNNKDLAAILSGLKETAPAPAPNSDTDGTDESTDDTSIDDDEIAELDEVKKPPFYICDGKSLTTKAGLKGPGDEVKPEYLAGGKERIKELIETGVIAKG